MKKVTICHSSAKDQPDNLECFVNTNLDVCIKFGDDYITLRPHHAAILVKELAKEAQYASRKIASACKK